MATKKKPSNDPHFEENYLISWDVYDHETHRRSRMSIGFDGNYYLDGKAIQKRIDIVQGKASEEE